MVAGILRIIIKVPELAPALTDLRLLLGSSVADNGWQLGNTRLELRADRSLAAPCIAGIVIATGALAPVDSRGLLLETEWPSTQVPVTGLAESDIAMVDHVVLQTRDANDCIRLFQRDLGIRLALDQQVPKWGGRMLFFRAGKLTLEVIENVQNLPDRDHFWGIAYHCPDIAESCARLDASGVQRSAIREGRKPGTRVATVKSHQLGIPTLLVGPG